MGDVSAIADKVVVITEPAADVGRHAKLLARRTGEGRRGSARSGTA